MGLFQYSFAGGGFLLIGAWESYAAATEASRSPATGPHPQPPEPGTEPAGLSSSSSAVTFLAVSVLSFLFIVNSAISISDAIAAADPTGSALQLEVIAISLLFLLYSVLGFVTCTTRALQLPPQILNSISLFAFAEEFLLFYLQRKDPSGVENRYYNLLLVPISICAFSTILELKTPKSNYARLGLGVGLISQGIWFLQMGFSFFTGTIAHGCALHRRSRGNYTIKCDGHPAYHRGGAIATLQFNCHLALLVALVSGAYSVVCRMNGIEGEASRYRPLGAGAQQLEMGGGGSSSHFTLDSDEDYEDDEENDSGIKKEEKNLEMQEMIQVTNGYHTHG